jgi:hypothetical protein
VSAQAVAEKQAAKDSKQAAKDAKDLGKLGLPDTTDQPVLPANWFVAKQQTNYDNLPFEQQAKIHSNWLDQGQVRLVTADHSKATTARAELESRIPAPVKPTRAWYDTDIIDKTRIGFNNMIEGGAKVAASYMPGLRYGCRCRRQAERIAPRTEPGNA